VNIKRSRSVYFSHKVKHPNRHNCEARGGCCAFSYRDDEATMSLYLLGCFRIPFSCRPPIVKVPINPQRCQKKSREIKWSFTILSMPLIHRKYGSTCDNNFFHLCRTVLLLLSFLEEGARL